MPRSLPLRSAIVAAAVAAIIAVGVHPASAAEAPSLPAGSRLMTVGCGADPFISVSAIDVATGALTEVGEPELARDVSKSLFCGGQGAFDPVTGLSYFPFVEALEIGLDESADAGTFLYAFDGSTGQSGLISEYPAVGAPRSLTVANDGSVYALGSDVTDSGLAVSFLSVDLETGAVQEVVEFEVSKAPVAVLTVDRATGVLYAVSSDGVVWTIDPTNGDLVRVGLIELAKGRLMLGAAIDSNGTFWFSSASLGEMGPTSVDLSSFRLADLLPDAEAGAGVVPTPSSSLTRDGQPVVAGALWIAPVATATTPTTPSARTEPAVVVPPARKLAETGTDQTLVLFTGLLSGSFLLLGAGVILAARSMRLRRG